MYLFYFIVAVLLFIVAVNLVPELLNWISVKRALRDMPLLKKLFSDLRVCRVTEVRQMRPEDLELTGAKVSTLRYLAGGEEYDITESSIYTVDAEANYTDLSAIAVFPARHHCYGDPKVLIGVSIAGYLETHGSETRGYPILVVICRTQYKADDLKPTSPECQVLWLPKSQVIAQWIEQNRIQQTRIQQNRIGQNTTAVSEIHSL